MHLVNTIKYLYMSFFEISVCIIIFNNGTQYQQLAQPEVEEAKITEIPWYFSML